MLGRLHVITDNRFGRDPRSAVPVALEGGADVIQVRVKGWTDRDLLELAEQVAAWCQPYGAACIVNDRVDVALAAGPTASISEPRTCQCPWRVGCSGLTPL